MRQRLSGRPAPLLGRTAVVTMVMKRDFPHAAISMDSIASQLGAECRHFVLINDHPDEQIEELVSAHQHREALTVGENVGVAPGRNRLIKRALEWGAERIVVFDDDLLAPSDYLSRIVDAHTQLQQAGIPLGAIAPAVLNYHQLGSIVLPSARSRVRRSLGKAEQWRARVRRMGNTDRLRGIEHLGIRDWRDHYLSVGQRAAARFLHRYGVIADVDTTAGQTVLANSVEARQQILSRNPASFEVDTLPGGVWCVGRDAFDTIGLLNEHFAPFGFEDAEWCIRARRAGLRNFSFPAIPVLHDLQARLTTRDEGQVLATRGRARALLATEHGGDDLLAPSLLRAIAEPCEAPTVEAALSFYYEFFRSLLPRLQSTEAAPPTGDLPAIQIQGSIAKAGVDVAGLSFIWPDGARLELECQIRAGAGGAVIGRLQLTASGHTIGPRLSDSVIGAPIGFTTLESALARVGDDEFRRAITHVASGTCDGSTRLTIFRLGASESGAIEIAHQCHSAASAYE